MRGTQIASLIFAIILLLPGGCFMVFGVGMLADPSAGSYSDVGGVMTAIGLAILSVVALLFWLAFRKGKPISVPPPPVAENVPPPVHPSEPPPS